MTKAQIEHFKKRAEDKPNVTKAEYLEMLALLEKHELAEPRRYAPEIVARYDIIKHNVCGIPHPCIVYKVDNDLVYAISMSTTDAPHNVFTFNKSRMYKGIHLTNTVVRVTKEQARIAFLGIFDNRKEADQAIGKVKQFYKHLFKL